MDILELLSNLSDFSRTAYGKWVIGVGIIGLIVLYVAGRAIVGTIYYALFPSKRPWRTKSFEEEVEENRNKPISDSESIGSISMRLGEDVRDVWEMGYSKEQVNDVLTGKYTLEEMYKRGPAGNSVSKKGREILGSQEQLAK